MDNYKSLYQQRLNLQQAAFLRIEHEDTMVADVYKIICTHKKPLILKICPRVDDYLREVYFLKYFAELLPVPHIIQEVSPDANFPGAILMEYLQGDLLKKSDLNLKMAHEIGLLLASIHIHRIKEYGDLIHPNELNENPRINFKFKFEESLSECTNHLSKSMLDKAHHYFDQHIQLLDSVDGPCIVHRDFRPGNTLVYNGKLQGIIDWSSARASFAEEDFCALEKGEWSTDPKVKQSFLEGYASIRPVPHYHHIMPLLCLSNALAIMGCTIKQGTWENMNAQLYQRNLQFLESFLGDFNAF